MTNKLGTADLKLLSNMPICIGNKVYNYDPAAFLVINPSIEGINELLARIPGDFAHWATLESMARIIQEEVEDRKAVAHAKLYRRYEKELVNPTTNKPPTVDAIKSAIVLDPDYQTLAENLRNANHAVNNCMAMRQAMQHKKDCGMAIAHNLRGEREAHLGDQLKSMREKIHASRATPVYPK